ncbi:dynein light chain roadblock-type 2 [Drosophila willistoni]|uniref:dynein light chain roadblock-type 2 n=1 Tax=Drosophila willistoni TaxID=7260 RepID=UPI00017D6C84|nr:dynein light chain roadblock-type 2 [Drosophila willistoni]
MESREKEKKTRIQADQDRSYDGDAFVNLFAHRGAREILVLDGNGYPLRSTISHRRTYIYASYLKPLTSMARNVVRDLDPANDVVFMRIRSEINEVHITTGKEFILIVVQKLKKRLEKPSNKVSG